MNQMKIESNMEKLEGVIHQIRQFFSSAESKIYFQKYLKTFQEKLKDNNPKEFLQSFKLVIGKLFNQSECVRDYQNQFASILLLYSIIKRIAKRDVKYYSNFGNVFYNDIWSDLYNSFSKMISSLKGEGEKQIDTQKNYNLIKYFIFSIYFIFEAALVIFKRKKQFLSKLQEEMSSVDLDYQEKLMHQMDIILEKDDLFNQRQMSKMSISSNNKINFKQNLNEMILKREEIYGLMNDGVSANQFDDFIMGYLEKVRNFQILINNNKLKFTKEMEKQVKKEIEFSQFLLEDSVVLMKEENLDFQEMIEFVKQKYQELFSEKKIVIEEEIVDEFPKLRTLEEVNNKKLTNKISSTNIIQNEFDDFLDKKFIKDNESIRNSKRNSQIILAEKNLIQKKRFSQFNPQQKQNNSSLQEIANQFKDFGDDDNSLFKKKQNQHQQIKQSFEKKNNIYNKNKSIQLKQSQKYVKHNIYDNNKLNGFNFNDLKKKKMSNSNFNEFFKKQSIDSQIEVKDISIDQRRKLSVFGNSELKESIILQDPKSSFQNFFHKTNPIKSSIKMNFKHSMEPKSSFSNPKSSLFKSVMTDYKKSNIKIINKKKKSRVLITNKLRFSNQRIIPKKTNPFNTSKEEFQSFIENDQVKQLIKQKTIQSTKLIEPENQQQKETKKIQSQKQIQPKLQINNIESKTTSKKSQKEIKSVKKNKTPFDNKQSFNFEDFESEDSNSQQPMSKYSNILTESIKQDNFKFQKPVTPTQSKYSNINNIKDKIISITNEDNRDVIMDLFDQAIPLHELENQKHDNKIFQLNEQLKNAKVLNKIITESNQQQTKLNKQERENEIQDLQKLNKKKLKIMKENYNQRITFLKTSQQGQMKAKSFKIKQIQQQIKKLKKMKLKLNFSEIKKFINKLKSYSLLNNKTEKLFLLKNKIIKLQMKVQDIFQDFSSKIIEMKMIKPQKRKINKLIKQNDNNDYIIINEQLKKENKQLILRINNIQKINKKVNKEIQNDKQEKLIEIIQKENKQKVKNLINQNKFLHDQIIELKLQLNRSNNQESTIILRTMQKLEEENIELQQKNTEMVKKFLSDRKVKSTRGVELVNKYSKLLNDKDIFINKLTRQQIISNKYKLLDSNIKILAYQEITKKQNCFYVRIKFYLKSKEKTSIFNFKLKSESGLIKLRKNQDIMNFDLENNPKEFWIDFVIKEEYLLNMKSIYIQFLEKKKYKIKLPFTINKFLIYEKQTEMTMKIISKLKSVIKIQLKEIQEKKLYKSFPNLSKISKKLFGVKIKSIYGSSILQIDMRNQKNELEVFSIQKNQIHDQY